MNYSNKILRPISIIFILISGFSISSVKAQDTSLQSDLKNALIIEKLSLPITFDGIPDEEAWRTIKPIVYIMHSPVFGKDPSEKTDTRIAYDDKYLYFSSRLYFDDPSMIQSASLKRDYMGMGGDWFGVILDTYNDKENGMGFFSSPDGLRWDATILKDAVTGFPDQLPMNISWNTFWDVKTNIDNNGWSIELRIPFSSLRFQEINGEVRMGMILHRWIPAKSETDTYPAIPPNWGPNSAIKPSQAQEIVLRGVKPGKPIYIAPYLLGGYKSLNDLNSTETEYITSNKPALEAGIDIKYGITNNIVMDLTVNTDFAQVELDDQQINLTRFSLFFPEKRLFFLERSSAFDFAMGGNSNLFYSRRIGLSDDGDPVRIYGGSRITGRIGKWDMGILDMQTAPLWKKNSSGILEEILPSENFGVVRFRRQVINQNSFIGAIVTSRLGVDGSYNMAYGIDGIWRVFGDDYFDFKWSQTFEDNLSNSSLMDPTKVMANWERRSSKGLGYNFGYSRSGINFNPGIGFEMMEDYISYRATVKYGWLPGESSKLYSHSPQLRLRNGYYVDDGTLMSFNATTGWEFMTKSQWTWGLNLMYNVENLRDSLVLKEDEVFLLPSQYDFVNFQGTLTTPGTKSIYLMLKTDIGQYFDGNRFSINLQPTWNVSRHFEFGAIYNYDNLKFSIRNEQMTNHIVGIKATYMANTKLSVNSYIQYNTALKGILTNLRIRYNPKEGNDFYLVLNEGRNTSLTREIPNLPVYSQRSLLLKYTYTFSL